MSWLPTGASLGEPNVSDAALRFATLLPVADVLNARLGDDGAGDVADGV